MIRQTDILDAFRFRHACKVFDDTRSIADEQFAFILETARLSPCSFGLEPWTFLVVQQPDKRDSLRRVTWGGQTQLPTASHVLVCLVRKAAFMRYDSAFVHDFMRSVQQFPEDVCVTRSAYLEQFQRQDFDLLSNERHLEDWAAKQCYLPLANMMTAAAVIGIDSCPIEGFDKAALEQVLADEFAVDTQQWGAGYLVAFGYRQAEPVRPKTRQPLEAIVKWF